MIRILETERLYLREITEADAGSAYLLNLDPEVVRYTGDAPFESIDHAAAFLRSYDQYKKYGMGRWGVIDKTNDEFLGWCGLKYVEEDKEHDIGFRFFKKHWNKGFATESASACLRYGFEELQLTRIVGHAMKENLASIRVLEKIGLKYLRDLDCGGQCGVMYQIYRNTTQ